MKVHGDARELQAVTTIDDAKAGQTMLEVQQTSEDRDRHELLRLGKKPVLRVDFSPIPWALDSTLTFRKRNFGFLSILGLTCTILVTWEGSLVVFLAGFQNGGPAGVIYGFILVWVGSLSVFSVLSELVSMAPTAGGQYHWVSMLAPGSCRKFFSYITGWLTVAGWQATFASSAYFAGTLLQGLIVLTVPNYDPKSWHGTLLYWAVVFVAVFFNTVVSSLLPTCEVLILILHVVGFFAILIPLVVLGPHGNASDVFSTFLNQGGFPTQGVSFFVGLLGNVFAFLGVDGAFHMAEEVRNPSIVIPRCIILSIVLNGALGFGMLTALLFCLGDITAALNTNTGYPFMEIFLQATNSVGGSATMVALLIVLGFCCSVAVLTSTSRMFWSFARDRGMPFWRTLHKVHSRTAVPLWSIGVTTVVACLLSLIHIGSSTIFTIIVSLSVAGLYTSYLITSSLLLYRRCTGGIQLSSDSPDLLANTTCDRLIWGPWRIPGLFGIINNAFACAYLTITLFFSFWPPMTPTTAQTMNYSSLVLGAMLIFSVGYYAVYARRGYMGPVVEIEGVR